MNLLEETLGVPIVRSFSFSKCIICKVSVQNSIVYIGVIFRSPGHSNVDFERILSSFEKIFSNSFSQNALSAIILGDFDAISSFWLVKGKIIFEVAQGKSLKIVHQLVSQST